LLRRAEIAKRHRGDAARTAEDEAAAESELEAEAKRFTELAEKVEDSTDPARCRILGGSDPSEKELVERIAAVEAQLAEKEERLLEKDLILEDHADGATAAPDD
ncbi:hypothetical protein HK405_001607, partial [Cladochytrium tenue]